MVCHLNTFFHVVSFVRSFACKEARERETETDKERTIAALESRSRGHSTCQERLIDSCCTNNKMRKYTLEEQEFAFLSFLFIREASNFITSNE